MDIILEKTTYRCCTAGVRRVTGTVSSSPPYKERKRYNEMGVKGDIYSERFDLENKQANENKLMKAEAVVDSLVCTVWKNIAPPKVEFMLWLALLGKLNTRDLLVKNGVLPSHENMCSFCSQQSEDFNHLLLKCQYSWSIWCSFAAEFGVLMTEQQRQQDFRQFYEWWLTKNFHSQLFI
uniref:Reverse transcriptase zinc-binding domain-containing protein n=1 Tax=Opuntia streptacantha TaxID=393608 RepID=A0A7C8ZT10_OPUST